MKLFVTSFFIITFFSTLLYANDGKALYKEANCGKCHGIDKEYDPKNSKVKSLSDLKGWITNCAVHFNIGWFPEEKESVMKYLNETHYKFKN